MHARLFEQIAKGKPKAIAFDIQFSEYASIAEDNALGNALFRHPDLAVLSTTEVDDRGRPNLIFDAAALRELGARAGNANFPTDPDGIIRRFPHEVEKLEGFAIVAAEIARDKLITSGEMGGDVQWIDYAGSPGTVTAYPYSRVLKGIVPPSVVQGQGRRDRGDGAVAPRHPRDADGRLMSGPEIQANAIATALAGFPLRSLSTGWNIVLIVGWGCCVPLVSLRAGPLVAVAVGVVGYGLFSLGTQLAFEQGGRISPTSIRPPPS